ncbi:MAG: hypothetical protein VR72_02135 [Clostridiaceae bacterium BRH_c20a]|nr:MAG: hypothetical protein VR72_02135 [Clostridiaceae bacterium BRH_c20a]
MKYDLILASISRILIVVGISMIIPLLWSFFYGDGSAKAILYSIFTIIAVALSLFYFFPLKIRQITYIEGYLIVTISWLAISLFGTLPYLFSGVMNFTDAFFETVSGFTTTGASILSDIESLPKGILMWRALTQWLGGMGVIVLFVALVSQFGVGANKIFAAEAPGTVVEKVTPRISDTARSFWSIYMIFTVLQIISLYLAGMNFFDSMAHTFTTIATGGFSTKNTSIGYFMDNTAIQIVITLFMFLGGTNFALFYYLYKEKSFKVFWRNEEFKLYFKVVLVATSIILLSLYLGNPEKHGILPVTALFQVVSITTTTGFATVDYDAWPNLARNIMFLLLFVGGSLGSTAGGIKMARFLILLKATGAEIKRFLHPRLVTGIKINKIPITEKVISNTFVFFFVYLGIVSISTLILSFADYDLETSLTAVLACIGVIGPGLANVGPAANFSDFPIWSKYFLSLLMLIGRLEFFTILVLFYSTPLNKKN